MSGDYYYNTEIHKNSRPVIESRSATVKYSYNARRGRR
jgi:hypothetical protein